jgi:uncharacterized protein YodC (DUF2158 family)
MSDLREGDVVQLKSGGPHMTIMNIAQFNGKPSAATVWFEKMTERSGVFPLVTLDHVNSGEEPASA